MIPNSPVPRDPDTRIYLKIDIGCLSFEEVKKLLLIWKDRTYNTYVISGRYFHSYVSS